MAGKGSARGVQIGGIVFLGFEEEQRGTKHDFCPYTEFSV